MVEVGEGGKEKGTGTGGGRKLVLQFNQNLVVVAVVLAACLLSSPSLYLLVRHACSSLARLHTNTNSNIFDRDSGETVYRSFVDKSPLEGLIY